MTLKKLKSLEHLRIFQSVVEMGSMSRAADRLGLSQPSITHAIAQLESRLGCKLFDRTTRRMTLTVQGQSFYRSVVNTLQSLDQAVSDVRAISDVRTGALRIASTVMVSQMIVQPALGTFCIEHPQVRLRLLTGSVTEVARLVRKSEADIGFLSGSYVPQIFAGEDEELRYRQLANSRELFVAGGRFMALAGRKLSFEEIALLPLVGGASGSSTWERMTQTFAKHDIDKAVQYECRGVNALIDLVEMGLGITTLPERFVNRLRKLGRRLVTLDVDGFQERISCGCIVRTKEEESPAVSAFLLDAAATCEP